MFSAKYDNLCFDCTKFEAICFTPFVTSCDVVLAKVSECV